MNSDKMTEELCEIGVIYDDFTLKCNALSIKQRFSVDPWVKNFTPFALAYPAVQVRTW